MHWRHECGFVGVLRQCRESYDGDGATFGSAGSCLPDYAAYIFAAPKEIVEVAISSKVASSSQAPKDFTIDYWDVNHWVTAGMVTGSTSWANPETRTFTFGSAPSSRSADFFQFL